MSTAPNGWQNPKTNWASADVPLPTDFNRIEGNIAFLHDEFIIAGPETARPSPGHAGRLYVATGLAQRIWRDTGSVWELAAGVPKGVIQMWSGSLASIPQGWVLCDGRTTTAADGTQVTVPDLRDRFIVGAGREYTVGDTGGAKEVSLTFFQIPPHAHGITVTGTSGRGDVPHGHTMDYPSVASAPYPGEEITSFEVSTGTTPQGGGQPHENRPPYYALAYIMKL